MRLIKIKENYEQSVKNIELLLNGSEPELTDFFNWLNTTEVNPFFFLPKHHAYAFDTAEGFEELLNEIHHAVIDDGEICMVKTFLGYRIIFQDPYEENFKEVVYNLTFPTKTPMTPPLEEFKFELFNKSRIHEWGQLMEEEFIKMIKSAFAMDVVKYGEKHAVENYRNYSSFDENWLVTEKDRIDKWKNQFDLIDSLLGGDNEPR